MISVIVPLMNRIEHFRKLLDSVVRADRPVDLEMIVVDHGSTDGDVGETIGEECYIGLMQLPPPYNASVARNAGAEIAIGDILTFLDADMMIPEDYFQMTEEIVKPGTIFFPQCVREDERGKIIVDHHCTCGYGNCALLRADFERVGKWDEGYVAWGYEDPEFRARCLARGLDEVRLPIPGLVHQYHPNSWEHRNLYTAHPEARAYMHEGPTL